MMNSEFDGIMYIISSNEKQKHNKSENIFFNSLDNDSFTIKSSRMEWWVDCNEFICC